MSLRFFDWRDIPTLHSYREEMVYLNNELLLTTGSLNIFETILSSVLPIGSALTLVYTHSVEKEEKSPKSSSERTICQAEHRAGEEHAYLTFFAPHNNLNAQGVFALIDGITTQLGERGVLRILADVEEQNPLFELLHQAGFSIYARQRVWQMAHHKNKDITTSHQFQWRPYQPSDRQAIHSLYQNLVPIMIQRIAPPLLASPKGLVCTHHQNVIAFIEFRYGMYGICAYPFVHPESPEVIVTISWVLDELPGILPRFSRPIYAMVCHYQNWIENSLEAQGALVGNSQVLMVKHLTLRPKAAPSFIHNFELEKGQSRTLALSTSGENMYDSSSNH